MAFFSIITPSFNRAHLLGETIESVLNQKFTDFELIIVDDGSTDHTKDLVNSYKDVRINYIYQQNGERGKARNTGVKNAIGKYVFFLDSDDKIYTNHLSHAYLTLEKLGFPEFFRSAYEEIDANGVKKPKVLRPNKILRQIQKQNLFACQFFLRTDIANLFPFTENRQLAIGEDWELILKLSSRYPINISNTVTSAIIHHNERSMAMATPKVILESRDILLKNLTADPSISSDILSNVFSELTTLAGLSAAIKGQNKLAIKYWFLGFRKRPQQLLKRRTIAILKKTIFN
ncbi:MAG: glycosyltransferase family A protein [Putridiphycobacter sp.]|nr:glycosyltransferase family A protein [Putridiphycobacter sp.]